MNPIHLFNAAKESLPGGVMEFIRRPTSILRLSSILVSIIVFGCISSGCYTKAGACIYDGEPSACKFPTAVGVFAFLGAIVFLAADFVFNALSNIKRRKMIITGDLAFSGLWTFFWFITFCVLANKWINTSEEWITGHKVGGSQINNARSAILFSFVSIGLWGGITFFALQRFRMGDAALGISQDAMSDMPGTTTDSGPMGGQGYSGMPESMGQPPQMQSQQFQPQPQQQQQQSYPPMNQQMGMGGSGGQYYGPTY